jgi:translation initiation factor IF-3
MQHQELGRELLDRLRADLAEYAIVEQDPRLEGRLMVMMLAPKKK